MGGASCLVLARALRSESMRRAGLREVKAATERFIKSGAVIKDVFGRLGEAEEEQHLCL